MTKKLLYSLLTILSLSSLALSLAPFLNLNKQSTNLELKVGGGTPASAYSSTLSLGESSTDTTINVNSVVAGDTTLTTELIYPGLFLTLEPQTSSKRELVFCTGISGTAFTGCIRGLSSVGTSMDAVTANQQSHQAGVLVINSDPAQFYSHILINRFQESWIYGKHHHSSATATDRTGFSLGDGSDVNIRLIFKDGTATSTAPQLYRQESTGNLIWSGNGVDEITLSGGGASSTCGRGAVCEAVTGGTEVTIATSTDTNSANRYGLSFVTESSRGRLILSGQYNTGSFTFADLFASSTAWRTSANVVTAWVNNSGGIGASGTSLFAHLVPSITNAFDLGSPTGSWRGLYASGTVYLSGSSTIASINSTTTVDGLRSSRNNGFDLGYWDNAFRNIFASGTIYGSSLNLQNNFNGSSTVYTDSLITFSTSTTGLYAYYHQATSTAGGPLTITIPIPGELLGANGSIRLNVSGSSTRPTDGVTATVAASFGGTTFSTFSFEAGCRETAPASSCTGSQAGDDSIMWQLTTLISNRNSKSIQKGYGTLTRSNEQFIATSSVYRAETLGAVNTASNQNLLLQLTSDNYTGGTHLGIEDLTVEILNAR